MIVSLKMALRSIGSNKMRAILTMLGIIIGVMALVVLVSLVNGATTSVTDKVSELGSSMVSATIVDDKGNNVFTLGKKKSEKKTTGTITNDDAGIYIALSNINDIPTLKEYYEMNKGNVNNQKQFHEMVVMRQQAIKESAKVGD